MIGPMSEPLTATLSFTVTDADTALAVGSGDLPVLGTPRLLAWCEAATCAAVEAVDGRGRLVGQGEVTRVAVDPERFLARLG